VSCLQLHAERGIRECLNDNTLCSEIVILACDKNLQSTGSNPLAPGRTATNTGIVLPQGRCRQSLVAKAGQETEGVHQEWVVRPMSKILKKSPIRTILRNRWEAGEATCSRTRRSNTKPVTHRPFEKAPPGPFLLSGPLSGYSSISRIDGRQSANPASTPPNPHAWTRTHRPVQGGRCAIRPQRSRRRRTPEFGLKPRLWRACEQRLSMSCHASPVQ